MQSHIWIGPEYDPPRWMRKEAYKKARRLHRLRWKRIIAGAFRKGEVGTFFGVNYFCDSKGVIHESK